jgi:hypothetical protein
MTEKEINEVDGALWNLVIGEEMIEVETTVYKFKDKFTPVNEDLGFYNYNILTFRPTEPNDTVEFLRAYIGDVRYFIDNQAKAGYNGVMVKVGCVPVTTVKKIIKATSKSWDISAKNLKTILSQV